MPKNKTKMDIQAELEAAQKRVAELEEAFVSDRVEQRFASVFRASPSQMALTDQTTGRYIEVNEAFLNTLGFSREEVLGKTATELNLFVDAQQRQDLLLRMRDQGFLRNEHVLVRAKTGEIRHGIFSAEFINTTEQKLLLTVMNDVTEKLQAEQRWQFALDGADEGVWDWDPQTNKVFYSKRWKSMLGYENGEIGNTLEEWSSRVHREDLPRVMKEVEKHLSGETPIYKSEHRVLCKDGTYLWVLDSGKVMEWSEDKKPLRVIGTHKDISDRKKAEEALRENEERFSRMFHANPAVQLIVKFDDGIVLDVNESFCLQTGFDRDELIGRSMRDLNLWQDPFKQKRIMDELRSKGGVHDVELEFWTNTGDLRTLLISFDLVEIRGVLCNLATGVDITSRKQAERDLRFREKQYHSLVETLDVSICRWLPDTTLTYANEKYRKIFNITGNAEGKKWIDLLPEAARASTATFYSEVTKHPRTVMYDHPVTMTDGKIHHYHWVDTPILGNDGEVLEFQSIGIDITDRKLSENALVASEKRLKSLVDSQSHYVIRVNMEGRYSYWNAQFEKEFGWLYESEGIQNAFVLKAVCSYHHERVTNIVNQCIAEPGKVLTVEIDKPARNGSIRTTLWEFICLTDELDQPYEIQCMGVEITGRKQAEDDLRKNEQMLRLFIEHSPAAIAMFDHEMRYIIASKRYLIDYRLGDVDLVGRSHYEIFPEMTEEHRHIHQRCLMGEIDKKDEDLLVRNDGTSDWVRYELRPWHQSNGEVGGLIFFSEVITERKIADEKLRESERKYRELINGMNDTVWVIDFDTRFLDVNDAAVKTLGYTREELLSMKVSDIDSGIEPEKINQLIDRLKVEKRQVFETSHVTKNGRKIPIEVSSSLVSYMGEMVVMSIARDITDRKQAEEEARLAEQRYRSLIENAPDGIVLVGIDGHFKYASPSVRRLFGYSIDETLQSMPEQFTHPEDLPGVLKELEHLVADPTYIPTLQYRFLHKNGEWRWIESTFSNLVSVPSVEAIIINFRDIHERKLAEEALTKSQALLTEAQRIGRIGHMEWNGSGQGLICSDELYDILEIPYGAQISKEIISNMMKPGEAERIHELDMQAIQNHTDMDYEYCIQLKDGRERWLHQQGKFSYNQDGRPIRMLSIVQDITERKQTEEALRAEQARLAGIADTIPGAILTFQLCPDGTFNIPYASKAFEDLYGLARDDVRENIDSLSARVPHNQMEKLLQSVNESAKTLQPWRNEYVYHHPTKGMIWIEGFSMPMREADGTILWNGFASDVTERKTAEATLQESRLRLEMALKGANAGMWDWNVQTGETVFNDRWADIVGYSLQELEPISIQTWADLCHPDDLKLSDALLQKHFARETEFYECEVRMRHKDGSWVWVVDRGKVMEWDADGKPLRMFGTHLNITERKLSEEEIRKRGEDLLLINTLNDAANRGEPLSNILNTLIQDARNMFDCQDLSVYLLSPDGKYAELQNLTLSGKRIERIEKLIGRAIPRVQVPIREDGYFRQLLSNEQGTLIEDVASIRQWIEEFVDTPTLPDIVRPLIRKAIPQIQKVIDINTIFAMPLFFSGNVIGLIELSSHTSFDKDDLKRIRTISRQMSAIILRIWAVEKLRESEEKYRTLYKEMPIGVLLVSVSGEVLDANSATLQILGSPSIEATRQINLLTFAPLIEAGLAADFKKTVDSEQINRVERHYLTKWGKSVHLYVTFVPVITPQQELVVQVLIEDITARKDAENNLRASEEKYRSLIKSLNNSISIVDANGTFLYLNDMAGKELGGPPAELIGKTMHDLFPEPFSSMQLELVQNVIKIDHGYVYEAQSVVNNELRWFRVNFQPLHNENGEVNQVLINANDIHDLKVAQDELQKLNRNLEERVKERTAEVQDLYENAPTGYYSVDAEGKFVRINKTLSNWLGITQQEVIGRVASDFIAERTHEVYGESFSVLTKSGLVKDVEIDLVRKDGSVLPVLLSATAIRDEAGNFVMSRSTVFDNTERKQAEIELKRNVNFTSALLNAVPTPVFYKDNEGRYLGCNQSFVNMMGKTAEEIYGKLPHEIWENSHADLYRQKDIELFQSNELQTYEGSIRDKHGSLHSAIFVKNVFLDESGKTAGLVGAFIDITERKQAELAIRESEATYRALFENSNDGIFLMSPTGEELRANQHALDLVGYTLDEYLNMGGVSQNPFTLDDDERKDADDKLAALIRGETVPLYERLFTAKDGHKVPVEINLSPVRDANGNLIMVQSVVRDISQRKAAEDALRTINKELERALRVKDEFLANMSHELRTPLNGILGFSEILLSGEFGSLSERQHKYISSIEGSGKHLLGLINDLLDLSKIEAGKLDVMPENVIISDLCQSSLVFVKQMALKKKIHLALEQDMAYPFIIADQRRLKQILVNLLSNAVKFTPENGKVTLRVAGDPARGCINFSVEDTGIGISPEDLKRLFTPFTQVDSSLTRQYEGTGLGLVLVQKLAELHGGGVAVQSEVGKGSTFTVFIPGNYEASMEEMQDHETTKVENKVAAMPTNLNSGKILLAEDIESNIVILGDYLEFQGYTMVYARNGKEALDKAKETLPDLILMDIQMPVMDGLEATRRLRTDSRFATVPIIALTALAMSGDRERCIEAGATEYVSKPMSLKDLTDLIQELIKKNK